MPLDSELLIRWLQLFIVLLLFLPSNSYAEWKLVSSSYDKNTKHYVDFDRIRENDGNVYFWLLSDFTPPILEVFDSSISYNQADCNQFKVKTLTSYFHRAPMGEGTMAEIPSNGKWLFPPPNTILEGTLKSVCDR